MSSPRYPLSTASSSVKSDCWTADFRRSLHGKDRKPRERERTSNSSFPSTVPHPLHEGFVYSVPALAYQLKGYVTLLKHTSGSVLRAVFRLSHFHLFMCFTRENETCGFRQLSKFTHGDPARIRPNRVTFHSLLSHLPYIVATRSERARFVH